MLRLFRIVWTHKKLVEHTIARCDKVLENLVPNDPSNGRRSFEINFWGKHPFAYRLKPEENCSEPRCHYISSVIYDDDWPGDTAPRIDWLKFKRIKLEEEDAEDGAMMMALYIRFALRSARKELWSLFVQTHPLLTVVGSDSRSRVSGRVSLGRVLRRLANGSSGVKPPPLRAENPVEVLLNIVNGSPPEGTAENSSGKVADIGLADVGASLFWTAVELSADEVSQAVGKFPQVCRCEHARIVEGLRSGCLVLYTLQIR